eukprot:CAMPEP_0113673846 /NCGR_PEP_ID=MMETSP0038_2-20120614/7078_1 /TAXON_ID=2898 /ORGANISM="Cryptomonas paramecium" /LENGTH=158 /DNA_ID=CAMNT_0000590337 /DNA_START=146 /DNA_END=619 /DNA_ORIENTATION=+ /assembly_acc=CAM_ASM_000170
MNDDFLHNPWKVVPDGASEKVKAIFQFLNQNPVDIVGTQMEYEPKDVMRRQTKRPFASSPAFDLTPSDLLDPPAEGGPSHFAVVACGLLQLACGGLDECHNAVTPLSWDAPTSFAGPPIADSPARAEATYAHHLVHMREGGNVGEFGTGWNNSGYWAS